jgi:hypothetical protein
MITSNVTGQIETVSIPQTLKGCDCRTLIGLTCKACYSFNGQVQEESGGKRRVAACLLEFQDWSRTLLYTKARPKEPAWKS